ncbi:unnamed protein product, partial [Prorocentrum cordatum]
ESNRRLQQLYGKRALPDDVLEFFNTGIGAFRTAARPGASEADIRRRAYDLLYKHLFKLESKPIVTRFWLFTDAVFTLLRFVLLGLPADKIFTLSMTKPQEENQKRLTSVKNFFSQEDCGRLLRKASLCLRLTQHATSITGQTKKSIEEHRKPLLLRLAQGDVQAATSRDLQVMIPLLGHDPALDIADALYGLLLTQGHIVARFSQYAEYPLRLWKIVREFNSEFYSLNLEVTRFLLQPESRLDAGFSLRLRREALRGRSEAEAQSWLLSDAIQTELKDFFFACDGNSLDAERAHSAVKRNETSRSSGLAKCSRNGILQRVHVNRQRTVCESIDVIKQAEKDKFMNAPALAKQRAPELFKRPRGKLHWERGITDAEASATVQPADKQRQNEYMRDHGEALKAEAAEVRRRAEALLARLQNEAPVMPVTNSQWLQWLQDNDSTFREHLANATAQRRPLNARVAPWADVPDGPRLLPQRTVETGCAWSRLLASQPPGVYCLDTGDQKCTFFAFSIWQEAWAIFLPRQGRSMTLNVKAGFVSAFGPAVALLEARGVSVRNEGCELTRLRASVVKVSADEVELRVDEQAKAGAEDGDDDEVVWASDASDVASACSDPESAAEDLAEDTFTAWRNLYFTLQNHDDYPNAKIKILSTWCKDVDDGGMGTRHMSKTLKTKPYDGAADIPVNTYACLRAWMIWRFQQHGFAAAHPSRAEFLASEVASLRKDIEAMGHERE